MVGRRFGSVGRDALRASPDGSVIPGESGNVAAVGVGGVWRGATWQRLVAVWRNAGWGANPRNRIDVIIGD
jgi:hypothetical protein